MGDKSGIEWTDATWNPIVGCSVVSPGCTNCYAMTLAGTRLKATPAYEGLTTPTKAGPVWNGKLRLRAELIDQPLRWTRPRLIFVNSMGDLFHPDVPDEWLDQIFMTVALAKRHTFQILTKRPDRIRPYWERRAERLAAELGFSVSQAERPLPNVWMGTSVEDQSRWNERAGELWKAPAVVRFFSFEPLLGPIDTGRALKSGAFHWAIAGGEHGDRPMHPEWARSLRDQCAAAGVPFLFKQWGDWWPVSQMPDTEEHYDTLYHPAPYRHPEARRRPKVLSVVQNRNGSIDGDYSYGAGSMLTFRVGKARSGRLLDGQLHDAYPEVGA